MTSSTPFMVLMTTGADTGADDGADPGAVAVAGIGANTGADTGAETGTELVPVGVSTNAEIKDKDKGRNSKI